MADSAAAEPSEEVVAVQAGNQCPQCQTPNSTGARYCAACGAPLKSQGGQVMKLAKLLIFAAVASVVGIVIALGCVWKGYNNAIALDENVNKSWAQVENLLQRRFDLIPNLVETVKGVAGQEEKIFLGVAEARKAYTQAQTVPAKVQAANGFETAFGSALSRLLVIQERYPELKSNESFLKLQDSLEGSENRLAVERKRYNDSVGELNKFVRKITGSFYARLAGVEKAEYFQVQEAAKETPKVDFSTEK